MTQPLHGRQRVEVLSSEKPKNKNVRLLESKYPGLEQDPDLRAKLEHEQTGNVDIFGEQVESFRFVVGGLRDYRVEVSRNLKTIPKGVKPLTAALFKVENITEVE